MAQNGGGRSSILSLPNLLILVLMATGLAVYRPPLQAPRFATSETASGTSASSETTTESNPHNSAEVPLWQDPFLAAARFENPPAGDSGTKGKNSGTRGENSGSKNDTPENKGDTPENDGDDCEDEGDDDKNRPWAQLWAPSRLSDSNRRVMLVMTPAASTQEGVEFRLRSRQAVIGALRSEGFTPAHAGIIFHVAATQRDLSLADPWESNRFSDQTSLTGWPIATATSYVQQVSQAGFGSPAGTVDEPSGIVVLPYEWYQRDEVRQRAGYVNGLSHVLVVWLPEGKFGSQNLAALESIMNGFQDGIEIAHAKKLSDPSLPVVDPSASNLTGLQEVPVVITSDLPERDPKAETLFALIGPTSSTTLSAMYKEAAERNLKSSRFARGGQLSIYVTTPSTETFFTTSFENAVGCSSLGALDDSFAETFHESVGLRRFFRVCETDDVVAGGLVEELETRGLNIIPTSADWKISQSNHDEQRLDNVALICEHETLFGRAFAQTFSAAMWHRAEGDAQSYRERDGLWRQSHASLPPNLHVYFYPRGLKDQASQQQSENNMASVAPSDSTLSPQMPEPPEGLSQLDYIRRLANSLSLEYRRAGRYRLRAIGIVGTDVYDKMLLLQALRAEFPDMLFFTTDLDARLLHFNNFHFTRNLIVGSSYGLTLRDRYQRTSGIAAFRDSGQTAAYVACRLAISADHSNVRSASSVNPDELGVILPEQVRKSIRAPLLFEVGREVAATLSPLSQDADSLHPAPFRAVNASNAFLTFIAVTLFLAMAVYVFPPIRNRISSMAYAALEPFGWRPANDPLHQVIARPEWHQRLRDRRKYLLWAVGGIGFLTSLALAVAIYHSHFGGGEPFAITAGYSTWPSIIINQIAFVLTLFFFVEAWYTIRYTECRLDHEFHLHGERVASRAGFLLPLSVWWPGLQNGQVSIDRLWEQCKSLGSLPNRLTRVGIMFITLSAFWATMYLLYGDANDPLRGAVNLFWGRVMSNAALALLALLTLIVVDATTLVLMFVRNLASHESVYKPVVLRHLWNVHFVENAEPAGTRAKAVPDAKLKQVVPFADISIIGELTNSVYQIILYPFIVLTLMILARSGIFDHFAWSKLMLTVYGMLFGYAIWCAIVLQRTAERTRGRAIESLQRKLDAVRLGDSARDKEAAPVYEAAIRQTQNVSHGAFMSFVDNPLLRAVLLPTGGTTLMALLQYLTSAG